MKKFTSVILVGACILFGCGKNEQITEPKKQSPANGTYQVIVNEKYRPDAFSGEVGYDSTYSSYLEITGTWDSIHINSPVVYLKGLFVTYSDIDTLHYYLHWPPPQSQQTGEFFYYKQAGRIFMKAGLVVNHLGTWEYTVTQL